MALQSTNHFGPNPEKHLNVCVTFSSWAWSNFRGIRHAWLGPEHSLPCWTTRPPRTDQHQEMTLPNHCPYSMYGIVQSRSFCLKQKTKCLDSSWPLRTPFLQGVFTTCNSPNMHAISKQLKTTPTAWRDGRAYKMFCYMFLVAGRQSWCKVLFLNLFK